MSNNNVARYDADKIRDDMALRGWNASELGRQAGVSQHIMSRFLRGIYQTPANAIAIAAALGYPSKRYLVRRAR